MTAVAPFEVKKPITQSFAELGESLTLIRDCIDFVKKGQRHFLIALSGQLRALLIENDQRAESPLYKIAELLDIEISFYCMPDVENGLDDLPQQDKLKFVIVNQPITAYRISPKQIKLSSNEFKKFKCIRYDGTSYNIRNIIEWFANKSGGAHYSKLVPIPFLDIQYPRVFDIRSLDFLIISISESVIAIGQKVLNEFSSQDLNLVVGFKAFPEKRAHIIDSKHSETGMRFVFGINQVGIINFDIVGLDGKWIRLTSQFSIDLHKLIHVNIEIYINQKLNTQIDMFIDGVRAGSITSDNIILCDKEPTDFDMLINSSHENDKIAFSSFVLATWMAYNKVLGPIDRAKKLLYLDQDKDNLDSMVIEITPDTIGRSKSGTKDIVYDPQGIYRSLGNYFK